MIRTRPQEQFIAPDGKYVLVLTKEELQLIAALNVMCRLGSGKYEQAALEISDKIDEIVDEVDFGLESLVDVSPKFSILDPLTLDEIAEYDENFIIEIRV